MKSTHKTRACSALSMLLLALDACSSSGAVPGLGADAAAGHAGAMDGAAGSDAGAPLPGSAGGGGGVAGATPDAAAGAGGSAGGAAVPVDPGFVGMRRLSDAEYANSLQAVLGLSGRGAEIATGLALGATAPERPVGYWDASNFDNLAGTSTGAERYQEYFDLAASAVDAAFASADARARILTCAPAAPTDETCARAIITAFGLRAWRRPLLPADIDALTGLARAALSSGADFTEAMRRVVHAMLVSESFLYRIELDPPAPTTAAHALTSYELATRLSYLIWSAPPDDALLQLAATNALADKGTLAAQARRLLDDPRAAGFILNFFGQWLDFRRLSGPALDRSGTNWSASLQASMATEAALFVGAFVKEDHPVGELLTMDVNFVDDNLAALYHFSPEPPGAFVRVAETADQRKGFLGLAALLTLTSRPDRTSATWRGRWILEHLLCMPVPEPPPNTNLKPQDNPREQFMAFSNDPACSSCHSLTDRLGFGLEKFDQIGRDRLTYEVGSVPDEPIDDHGVMPDGTPFTGLGGLANRLAADPRLPACATRAALSYAVGRPFSGSGDDAAVVARIAARGGAGMRALLAALVVDDVFTNRRGEEP